ncbi:hemerythrin domain-containing protein [Pseudolysobacter antarcticus]|uniref:Hemerythrin domain-containing protein n=1 Tax=Pseudolysobacter antarcticus TaxID=2511995 RepID=A0A411HI01_9GAMM|nr:hemerythrin domain-containing protein [Pseudolysobacter antarcticus]QBB70146.1 hemerythrin domain-containing protein [Pseudolysobacter antarcticus]
MPAVKKAPAKKTVHPDAIQLLKADHAAVSEMFDKYEAARSASVKEKLSAKICKALEVHTQIEEEIFYPALRNAKGTEAINDLLDEADVEHDGAKKLISEIEASQVGADLYDARIKVLSEYIRHHVKEETTRVFPAARKAGLDLLALGNQLAARKKELGV